MGNNIEQFSEKLNLECLPKHVAIIMDGNGRWAKKRFMPRSFGHKAGADRVKQIVRTSSDIGIKYLTVYAFSTENWRRPRDEVSILMSLIVEFLKRETNELNKNNVRLRMIGDISGLSDDVIFEINRAQTITENNSGMVFTIALNYGSRLEIISAIKKLAGRVLEGELDVEAIDHESFEKELETAGYPDPDLLIRTSGEYRISNFLLYQIAYCELYFTDKYWPDFDNGEYLLALCEYQRRSRRFGSI